AAPAPRAAPPALRGAAGTAGTLAASMESLEAPPPVGDAGCSSLSSDQLPWRPCWSPRASAEFSARQLEQLRSCVRAAMREEIWAQPRRGGSARQPPQGAARLPGCWGIPPADAGHTDRRPSVGRAQRAAEAAPLTGRNPRGKTADEPVAAVQDSAIPAVVDELKEMDKLVRASSSSQSSIEECQTEISRKSTQFKSVLRRTSFTSLDSSLPWWQSRVKKLVHGQYFDAVMGLIIMVNCVFIGLEVQLKLEDKEVIILSWLDSIFLVWFLFEAILRFVADGQSVFRSPWFRFDVALVVIGIAVSWVMMPIVKALGVQQVPLVSQLLTLRILRLLRTVRAFRMMSAFSELCRLCSGLLRSLRTMLSVGLMVFVSLFSFSVLGVDLITHSEKLNANDETRKIVESRFASLPEFMLTLMQFATQDSIASIYYPLMQEEPLLTLYFCGLWMVIAVALMNLVTAVIVDSALSLGREEADLKQAINRKVLQKNIPNLEAMFEIVDKDNNGTISFQELHGMHQEGKLIFPKDISSMIDPEHLVDMFEFVDKDKSGEIDKDEFIEGVCCLALSSMSIEALQMLQLLRGCHQMLVDIQGPNRVHVPRW
ncbi:unnamed protein product, partial [Prorocentrum cordatum]